MIEVNFSLIHHGDWTEFTNNFDITLKSLHFFIDPINNRNVEIMLVQGNNIKNFIRQTKNNKVIKTLSITRIAKDLYQLNLIGEYKSSVRRVFFENQSIMKSLNIGDGMERFSILLLYKNQLETLLQNLDNEKNVSVVDIKFKEINISTYLRNLTALEREIILRAYDEGFFNNPRNISLEELSNEFKISKSSLNFHLRNALKKIISFYLYNEE